MRLSHRTVLITGASSGIGRALALALALAEENTVIAVARRTERLQQLASENPRIVAHTADLTSAQSRRELAAWVAAEHTQLDTLINNAGIQRQIDLTAPADLDRLHEVVETNLVAPIHLSTLLTEQLSTQQQPAIVNVTSALAFMPFAAAAVYSATKAAMHSLSLSQRHQLAPLGVDVYEVIPPGVDTELGHQDREDANTSHGGMSVDDFVDATLEGLAQDEKEIAVGQAAWLRQEREALFDQLNTR